MIVTPTGPEIGTDEKGLVIVGTGVGRWRLHLNWDTVYHLKNLLSDVAICHSCHKPISIEEDSGSGYHKGCYDQMVEYWQHEADSQPPLICFGCGFLIGECTCICPMCNEPEREGDHLDCIPF